MRDFNTLGEGGEKGGVWCSEQSQGGGVSPKERGGTQDSGCPYGEDHGPETGMLNGSAPLIPPPWNTWHLTLLPSQTSPPPPANSTNQPINQATNRPRVLLQGNLMSRFGRTEVGMAYAGYPRTKPWQWDIY